MDLMLTDKVAIVTGAASGMGRMVATMLAAEGVRVAAADRDLAGAERTAATITAAGQQCRPFGLDVTERASWGALREAVAREYGAIDILCNIAGPGAKTGQLDTDDAEWARQISGHL